MLVTARTPKTTAMMRGTIINATRLKWSVEAIFSIERSSLWRRRWADFDWNTARSFVAQDNRTSPAPEAVACGSNGLLPVAQVPTGSIRVMLSPSPRVMAGLVPAIHVFLAERPQERRGCPRQA